MIEAWQSGSDGAFRGISVYGKSGVWISSAAPRSMLLLRMSICKGSFSRANLFGKEFWGHIIFVGEGVLWAKGFTERSSLQVD